MLELLDWTGRTTRQSFFLTFLAALFAGVAIVTVSFGSLGRGGGDSGWPLLLLTGIGLLAACWIQVVAIVRRLHDVGLTGWLAAIPLALAALATTLLPDVAEQMGRDGLARAAAEFREVAAFLAVAAVGLLIAWPGTRRTIRSEAVASSPPAAEIGPSPLPVWPAPSRPKPKLPPRTRTAVPIRVAPPPRSSFGQRPAGRAAIHERS